jgi:hypothetical protein
MIRPRLAGQRLRRTEKSGSQLGDEFLGGVTGRSEPAAQVPIQAVPGSDPMP